MLKTKQVVIKPLMLACSAGLLLTACATYEDDASYAETSMGTSSTINESSGAQQGWQSGSATRSQDYSTSTTQQGQNWEQQQSSGQQSYSAQSGQSQQLQSGGELIIPLHEEQVNVGKRTVDAGTVTIRKVVTTETVNQPVQLRKETLVIDREGGGSSGAQFQSSASTTQGQARGTQAGVSAQATTSGVQTEAEFDQAEPAGAQQRSSSQSQSYSGTASGNAFKEQTYTIQLREEQPVVQKNVIQTGQVTARKNTQTQRQNIQREVRREDVQIDQGANAQNVEIRGNFDSARGFNEPSGAQRPAASQDRSVEQRSSTTTYQSETEIQTERDARRIGVESNNKYEDSKTLDDINQGSNTRGGAEDLQRFDEKAAGGRP